MGNYLNKPYMEVGANQTTVNTSKPGQTFLNKTDIFGGGGEEGGGGKTEIG